MVVQLVDEWWDVEDRQGVWHSLHTYAKHVQTIFGGRTDVPDLRGSNLPVYGVPGTLHRAKIADERSMTLAGWVTEMNEDGGHTFPGNVLVGFNQNWRMLRRLLWREDGEQFRIRRRWYDETGALITGIATAEYGGNMRLADKGIKPAARWSCDLTLSDPYFYGDEIVETLEVGVQLTFDNPGDVTSYPRLTFNGPITNGKITVDENEDRWFQLSSAVAVSDTVIVETDPRVLTVTRASDDANLIAAVVRSGSRAWLPIVAGANVLDMEVDAGTGDVTIAYRPAYL